MRSAALHVQEARAAYGIQRADRAPTLGVSADGSRSRVPGDLNATGRPVVTRQYQVVLCIAAWELDFWGRVRSLQDAALETYLATDAARRALTLSLVAEVAQGYLALRELDERLRLAQAAIISRNDSLRAADGLPRLLQHVRPLGAIRVAVVHPCDALSLGGALDARAAGLIEPVLVAPRAKLEAVAAEAGRVLAGLAIEDVPHSHAAAARAAELAGRGEVDAPMKGSLHTDELMSAVLAPGAGLRTRRRLSHSFLMQTPAYPRPFIITDAAINIAPTLAEKADIIRNAIELSHAIGVERPRVAILAAVETVNPGMPATLDAAALCKMTDRGQIEGGALDGPLAFDNAVSAAAARVKGITSPVAGKPTCLSCPTSKAAT